MAEPDQATMESVGISFHGRGKPGRFRAVCMAGQCLESRYSGSPRPSHSKFLFRDVRDGFIQLVMAECAMSYL